MLLLDTHVHLYPCHDPSLFFSSALKNLNNLDINCPTKGLCFTERAAERFFESLDTSEERENLKKAGWILDEYSNLSARVSHETYGSLWLFRGYQTVSREKIEVLSLLSSNRLESGLSARELIARTLLDGGIPVLPWSPGKWLGNRGLIVSSLINDSGFEVLFLGDISMRPAGFPDPIQFIQANESKRKVLAGTDPLPLPTDTNLVGNYASLLRGDFDLANPTDGILRILKSKEPKISTVGKRNSPLKAGRRYISNFLDGLGK